MKYRVQERSLTHVSSCQCLCHCDSLELPSHDVGLEDCSLPGSWKHSGPQTCSGLHHQSLFYYDFQFRPSDREKLHFAFSLCFPWRESAPEVGINQDTQVAHF